MVNLNGKKLCEYCFSETEDNTCPKCGYTSGHHAGDATLLDIGSILENRYVIGGVLGKGGFGITYLAFDMKLSCKVAIKEYYPFGLVMRNPGSTQISVNNEDTSVTFREGAKKFYDEARLVAQFNGNPNIVNVSDFFYANDTAYFVMGYLKGQTLKSYIQEKGNITPEQAVRLMQDVTNALIAAHGMNVLHRDISPDNIMLCSNGTIKLLDFGAAREVVAEGSQSLSVILKQGFAPLEQYQKKGKQGPWTDIYSLGATVYHSLTGDTLEDPMSRLEEDEDYQSNKYNIPENLWNIIHKATQLKSSDRYQDVYEMKEALNKLDITPSGFEVTESRMSGDKYNQTGATGSTAGIGVTMPLQESNVTMPLQESNVTMPLQESNMTMPLNDSNMTVQPVAQRPAVKNKKPLNKKLLIGIASGVCALILIIVLVVVISNKDKADSEEASEKITEELAYLEYENEKTHFSIEYPDTFKKQDSEGTLKTFYNMDVTIEAGYVTGFGDAAYVYSAEDFYNVALTRPELMEKVLLKECEIAASSKESNYYLFSCTDKDKSNATDVYVFDGKGDFGCYIIKVSMDKDIYDGGEYEDIVENIVASFEVTGSYQEAGYSIYEFPELGIKLICPDDIYECENSGGSLVVYPCKDGITDANVWMSICDDSNEHDILTDDIRVNADVRIKDDDNGNGRYTTEIEAREGLGRYPLYGVSYEYQEDGIKYKADTYALVTDDAHYKFNMKSSGEFYEDAYECFDTVFASMVITNQPYGMSFDDAELNVAGAPKEDTTEKTTEETTEATTEDTSIGSGPWEIGAITFSNSEYVTSGYVSSSDTVLYAHFTVENGYMQDYLRIEYTQGFPVGDGLSGEIDYDYHVGDNGWCTFYYTDNTTGEVTPLNKGTYTISLYNSFTGDLLATGSYTVE